LKGVRVVGETYTVEELKRAIEFTESVLQGFDDMINSLTPTSEEIHLLYRRRSQTLMILNQWKAKLLAADQGQGGERS
jgi:hypothetical protein